MIGVGKADWVRPPLPPNRTGGFPASGSPVSGFTSMRIDEPRPSRRQGAYSGSAGVSDPDLHRKAINMQQERRAQSEPSHLCSAQSVVASRCRHLRYGLVLATRHVSSTFLRPFARRALPRFLAPMDALTPERLVLRVLIRDNERRTCLRSGLLALCIKPSDRSASNHLLPSPGLGLVSSRRLPRDLSAASLAGTTASLGLRLFLAGSPRQPAESSSSSCGPVIHLQLLSTPSHEDAVTLGYKAQTQLRRGLPPR
jgi:hypothetical protein